MDQQGPDFLCEYMRGDYDRACDACDGSGKVQVADYSQMSKEQRAEYPGWAYKATMKGQCYIKALTDVPLPVRTDPVWTMPIK